MRKKKVQQGKHEKIEVKPQRRKRKRILLVVLILILAAGTAAEIMIIKSMSTADRVFVRSIQRGLYSGWDLDRNEMQLAGTGQITDTSFVDKELEAVNSFKNRKFQDEELGRMADDYISALRACRSAAHRYSPGKDYDLFWENFSLPYGKRMEALYRIYTGEYNLSLDDTHYPEEVSNLLLQGWAIGKTRTLSFDIADTETAGTEFRTDFVNDSGYDLKYLDIELELLDADGKVITTASVYEEDIRNGSNAVLRFFHVGRKCAGYRIIGMTCVQQES